MAVRQTTSGYAACIEKVVRAAWARHEQPGNGYVWASIPVPSDVAMADIPFLPECDRIEIERGADTGSVRLIYRRLPVEPGWIEAPCPRCSQPAYIGVNVGGPHKGQRMLNCVHCSHREPR